MVPAARSDAPAWRRWWWVALGALSAVLYVVVPHTSATELAFYDSVVVLCTAVAAREAWRREPGARAVPTLIALFLACNVVGELLWWSYLARGIDPFPSVADGIFLASYLPLAVASARLAGRRRAEPDRTAWLDSGVLTAAFGLVVWEILVQPTVGDSTQPVSARIFGAAYPLADVFVAGFVLVLVLRRRPDATIRWFLAGIAATMAADLAFAWSDLHDTFEAGSLVDVWWLLGFLCLAAATTTCAPEMAPDGPPQRERAELGRFVGVLAALLVPLSLLLRELASASGLGANTATVAFGTSVVILLLVGVRISSLLSRAHRLERRRGDDRLAALVHHSADAIVLVDRTGVILYASPALALLAAGDAGAAGWGERGETAVGASLYDLFDAASRPQLERVVGQVVALPTSTVLPVEATTLAEGVTGRHVEGTACNLLDDPAVRAIVLTLRDVTQRHALEAQLARRAFQDELTGLANRALFLDRVEHALARTRRSSETSVAVLFVDLDDFKSINDGLGHGAGDALLVQVGDRLRSCCGPSDTVARLGGDEFAVLLEDVEPAVAVAAGQRILDVLRVAVDVADVHFGVAASIGVAFAEPGSTVDTLLRDADLAMYDAKARGKARVEVFDTVLRERAERRLAIRVELPGALESEQFRLAFQPIHRIGGELELAGFEALARWAHPTKGLVPAADFIPIAEETGDIVALGRWVLGTACAQAAVWQRSLGRELFISVNVSGVQLLQPEFVQQVEDVLRGSGLPAHLLVIELTESVLVQHQSAAAVLHALRGLGVSIAIDDFGTGYSSLSYLQRFPVSSVKIDRSFVHELGNGTSDDLIRSIVAIAANLGFSTVAEGIESAAQLATLEELACDYAQGFHLGMPMTAHEATLLVRHGRRRARSVAPLA